MKRLSIIIVTYNSEKDIFECLDSIFKFSDIPLEELEIIIIDNCSKEIEATFSAIEDMYGDKILLVKNNSNKGYGQGNNVGIEKASAPIILIMNPDVRLVEPIFSTVLASFNNDTSLSMYGMKQMRSLRKKSNNSFFCTSTTNGYVATFLTALGNHFDWYWPAHMCLSGSCFFIQKLMFTDIGLFDSTIFMYGEENDIHYRMKKKYGTNIIYNKNLHYLHLTNGRKPSIEYEKTVLNSLIYINNKIGYPKEKTIRNALQKTRLQIVRERFRLLFGEGSKSLYTMLCEYKKILKSLQQTKTT